MDDERIAKEAEKSKREANVEESVDISVHTPLHSSVCSPSVKPRKSPQERCNLAPLDAGSKPDLDLMIRRVHGNVFTLDLVNVCSHLLEMIVHLILAMYFRKERPCGSVKVRLLGSMTIGKKGHQQGEFLREVGWRNILLPKSSSTS